MSLERSNWKITRPVLEFILESSKDAYPNEIFFYLSGSVKKRIINEVIVGYFNASPEAVIYRPEALPVNLKIVGTAHSHPSGDPRPSAMDLESFQRFGGVHIIVAYPFNEESWKAYNSYGEEIRIEVIEDA